MVKAGGPFLLPVGVPSDLFSCETGMYIWRTTPFDKMGWEKVPTPYRDAIMNHLKHRDTYEREEEVILDDFTNNMNEVLRKEKTTLLDNIAPLENEEKGDHDPYDGRTRKTKQAFEGYLERISHPKATDMKATSINRLKMSWRTCFNCIDCGFFLMRHMETYMGEDAKDYHCGFVVENTGLQQKQIEGLRRKYTTKMLVHISYVCHCANS
ncbi:hypothetical protein HanRHA438_Chr03g0107951 [Helianthus annuus]|uniref:uncharacterized protein LOC110930326 isoform X3 n=1 Tax=Helianthus annuus TaxID=4232 RepID=UPI001652ED18|nr:uncharacterized protein LOC110930326 isoform X3 [Helianthus annuus]KAJ0599512.1 hypothetical protein HanIR_Chr03g0105711 [Helianthus annuus]KAJ0934484.1 hypothetical protein HanRHA438_Chr03g0107951 [Helianthus annuus]